jgi:hypothetical protein
MHRSIFHIPYSLFAFSLVFCTLFLPHSAVAAEISIGVGVASADGSRDIAVLLRSSSPINALEGVVNVALNGEAVDINDAGSPVQFWIERPHLSDTKDKITFAGIIPGGFSGEAVLFYIHTKADPSQFVIDKDALRLLLNDGLGTAEHAVITAEKPLPARFVRKRSVDDNIAPNPFAPTKALLPTESGDTESLVFTAHDNESGVERYEISYSPVSVDPSDPSLVWESVSNPFPLQPSQSKKFIYVKAIDRAGNIRIAEVSPSSRISGLLMHNIMLFFGTISIVCVFVLSVLFFLKRRSKQVIHNDQSEQKK